MKNEKLLDKVRKDIRELAISYDVSESSIVWIGDNQYIIVKKGREIRI